MGTEHYLMPNRSVAGSRGGGGERSGVSIQGSRSGKKMNILNEKLDFLFSTDLKFSSH